MRKLTQAELKFLAAIPPDFRVHRRGDEVTLPGTLRPFQWPKGTNRMTVRNLWDLGLLKLGCCMPEELPCALTEEGKKAFKKGRLE